MRKYLILFSLFLIGKCAIAQVTNTGQATGIDLTSDDYRKAGLTEDQIKKAEEYKRKMGLAGSGISPADAQPDLNGRFVDSSSVKRGKTARVGKKDDKTDKSRRYYKKQDSTLMEQKLPKAAIFGQELFRNSNISVFEKAVDGKAPDAYILGAGDEINVAIWGFSVNNENLQVSDDGFVNSKLVGRVYIKGLRFADARALLRKKFAQVTDLNNSQFEVSLTYSKVISVNIVGEVFFPGSYTIPAINTAFNALLAARGPSQIGSVRNIYLKRGGKIIDTLDIYKFLMDPTVNPDLFLQNNDYIVVSIARKVVAIQGDVKRPAKYELKEKENLVSLLNYSGGINSSAFRNNIQVYRYAGNKRVLIDVNADSLVRIKSDFLLQDADSLIIGRIPSSLEKKVRIRGSVRDTGDYEFREGDRISTLISRAQGITLNAYLSRAYLYRTKEDLSKIFIPFNLGNVMSNTDSPENIILQNKDEIQILDKTDFADTLRISVSGSVHKPGKFVFSAGINLKDALYLAGGFIPGADHSRVEIARVTSYNEAGDLIPIKTIIKTFDVKTNLTLDNNAEAFPLEPFDEIFVRTIPNFEAPKIITLVGEVLYPGKYALLRRNERVSEVIERAGGLTQYAFMEGVQMYRSNDSIGYIYLNMRKALKRPASRFNETLFQGDSIVIPKNTYLVHITGAHGNAKFGQISSPYFGRRAGYYIRSFAGGFASISNRRKLSVIRANGIARGTIGLGLFNIYPRVFRGSTIYIPAKPEKVRVEGKPFDWNAFIEKTTIKITGLLTLLILAKTFVK